MSIEEQLALWTVRIAVLCYVYRVWFDFLVIERSIVQRWCARVLWTLGCGLMIVHIVLVYGVYHQWSHANAYAHTAKRTFEMTGLDWGGGIYFNYVLVMMWVIDVFRMWGRSVESRIPRTFWFWSVHLFFAFMMFNATVVFGPPHWKWIALGLFVFVSGYVLQNRK